MRMAGGRAVGVHHCHASARFGAHQVVQHADDRGCTDSRRDQQQRRVGRVVQREVAERQRDGELVSFEYVAVQEVGYFAGRDQRAVVGAGLGNRLHRNAPFGALRGPGQAVLPDLPGAVGQCDRDRDVLAGQRERQRLARRVASTNDAVSGDS